MKNGPYVVGYIVTAPQSIKLNRIHLLLGDCKDPKKDIDKDKDDKDAKDKKDLKKEDSSKKTEDKNSKDK